MATSAFSANPACRKGQRERDTDSQEPHLPPRRNKHQFYNSNKILQILQLKGGILIDVLIIVNSIIIVIETLPISEGQSHPARASPVL
jgi:hypothetical protein